MDTRSRNCLAAGVLIFVIILFIDIYFFDDIYFSGIAAVILVALGMSLVIMQDSHFLPDVAVSLRDDAKGVVVSNRGNDAAKSIHVAIVPYNIEFDIPELAIDARFEYLHHEMIGEAKAAVTFQNSRGRASSRTFRLSALGKGDDDLLKPVIPLFRWK